MDSQDRNLDESLGEVVLSVKSVMLLCGNSVECQDKVRERIKTMQDDEVEAFIDLFKRPRKNVIPQLAMAAGEIVLASMLLFLGIGILAPSLGGFNGPSSLLAYFESTQMYLINALPYFTIVLLADFILSIVLLSAAFYVLRESADLITNSGLRYR